MPPKASQVQLPPTQWTSKYLPGVKCQLCVIQADQTGDVSHVAAAAALDDNTDVLVISSEKKDETSELVTYFKSVTHHAKGFLKRERVRFIALEPGNQGTKARHVALYNMMVDDLKSKRVDLKDLVALSDQRVCDLLVQDQTKMDQTKSFGPSAASRLVAQMWRGGADSTSALFEKLADRLSYNPATLSINSIIKGAEAAGMEFPSVISMAVLSCLTPTGYNPEGDSDVVGQEQLANTVLSTSTVITIGHDNASGQGYHSKKYHLGEDFYKKDPIKNTGRGGQVSFFLALMQRYPGRLYQIGQKTGAMDAAALVGIPTVYIEDVGSPASGRMENWVGAVPFFRRAQTENPPTVLGKAMRILDGEIQDLAKHGVTKDIPNSRQKDPQTSMPRDQWRRIAMLFQGLIEPFSIAKGHRSDPVKITKACFEANEATLKDWDEQIQKLTPKQLEGSRDRISPGYTEKDLKTIKEVFDGVIEDYQKTGSILRDGQGNYVARS